MLLLLVLLLFIVVLYFLLLRPLVAEVSSKENAAETKQEELKELTQTIAKIKDEADKIDVEQLLLEKRIPVERQLDEYILTLQQMEAVTNSQIESIQFMYDSSIADLEEEEEEKTETTNEEVSDENEEVIEEDIEAIEERQIVREKPEGLEVLIVRVEATSPDYNSFIQLLEEIEELERISIITNLKYDAASEKDQFEDEVDEDAISFNIELTTFYYPSE